MIKSPSFSLFSSSITTKNSPRANAANASSIESKENVDRLVGVRSVGYVGSETTFEFVGVELVTEVETPVVLPIARVG